MPLESKRILNYVLRRPAQEDVYFQYQDVGAVFGDKQIFACHQQKINAVVKWAYVAWGPGPTLKINVKDPEDDAKIQRKGLGTALYVLACITEGRRIKSGHDQKKTPEGKALSDAMEKIDIEGIIKGEVSPETVGLYSTQTLSTRG